MIRTLENCTSLDQVVELINDDTAIDISREQLASYYALAAIRASETEINKINIGFHLGFLIEEGANFNFNKAEQLALQS